MGALVIVRGNSRSGKSTVASRLRTALPGSESAVIGQDLVRRQILTPGADVDTHAPALTEALVKAVLQQGLNAVVEGIWFSGHYGEMMRRLVRQHAGPSVVVRLEVPLEETLARHASSPEAGFFGSEDIRTWWRDADPLSGVDEVTLDATRPPEALVTDILRMVRLEMACFHRNGVL